MTLLNAIAGLIVPAQGTISLGPDVFFSSCDGKDVPSHPRKIGYVFQMLVAEERPWDEP